MLHKGARRRLARREDIKMSKPAVALTLPLLLLEPLPPVLSLITSTIFLDGLAHISLQEGHKIEPV